MRQLTLHLLPLLGLLACEHAPPVASPFVPAGQAPPPLVLREADLPPTAELDVLLDGLVAVGAQQPVWTLLETYLARVDRQELARSESARRLVATAVVRVSHAPEFLEHFSAIRQAVDLLMEVAAEAPETHFCRAYLRWILLADGQDGLKLGALEPRVVRDLASDLRYLTQQHPNWRGPGEFDPPRLRLELERVEALLATTAPRAPTETVL